MSPVIISYLFLNRTDYYWKKKWGYVQLIAVQAFQTDVLHNKTLHLPLLALKVDENTERRHKPI